MKIVAYHAPRPPASFLHLQHVKKPSPFSFKFDLVLKPAAAFFSEINPHYQPEVI